jgi:hypothetical protein
MPPIVGKIFVAHRKRHRDDRELFRLLEMQEVTLPRLEVENVVYFKFKVFLKQFDYVWKHRVSPALFKASGICEEGWIKVEPEIKALLRNAVLSRWAFLNHHMTQALDEDEKSKSETSKDIQSGLAGATDSDASDEALARKGTLHGFEAIMHTKLRGAFVAFAESLLESLEQLATSGRKQLFGFGFKKSKESNSKAMSASANDMPTSLSGSASWEPLDGPAELTALGK